MAQVSCCKDQWNGVKGESFEWHNNSGQAVTISQVTGSTWPFTLTSGFSVPANSKLACGLINTPGTYNYTAAPCSTLGNPKVVIIT